MLTARENYMIAARGGKPERVPIFPLDCNVFMPDFWAERDPVTGTDFCNIKWVTNDAGDMPEPGWKAINDIFEWKDTIKFPKVSEMDWEGMAKKFEESKDPDKVNICLLNTNGIFLIPVNMMGWEDALCTIYEEPEELESCVHAIADFFIELIEYVGKYIKPDIIFSGDDFAAAQGPFISRETFREIYKPHIKRINEAIHKTGALIEFHCCGNCQFLIEEILDADADIMQLPEPNEALLRDKERFGNRLVLTGGWDRHGPGCFPNATEEVVRESVRTAIDTYGKDGALIFWDGGIVGTSEDAQNKTKWVLDEAMKYGRNVYK
jgi:hypothetical protein